MRNNKTAGLVLASLFTAIIIIMAFTPLGYIPLGVFNATIIHIPVILGSLFCGPKKGAFLGFVFGLTSFIKNTIMPSSASSFVFSPVLASSVVGTEGIFKSAIIGFVPRILVGVVPFFVYLAVKKLLSMEQKKAWATLLNVLIGGFLCVGVRAFMIKSFESSQTVALVSGVIVGLVVMIALEAVTLKKNGNVVAFIYAGVTGAMTNTILVMGGILVLYKDAYAEALTIDPSAVMGIVGATISINGVIEAIVAAIIVSAIGLVLNRIRPIEGQK